MPRFVCTTPLLAVVVALTTACANTAGQPRTATSSSTRTAATDCRQLGALIAQAEQARSIALENQKDAWKAVVPFAVAARYAKSKAAAGQADQQLVALKTQYSQQGCERHGV
ncbi:hypothetical protein [Zoogloea sp.]|uniref:hypothetical protein n=1 Tax=Zoogloea sp. TaxID=49181 RepID=UPI0035AF1CD4